VSGHNIGGHANVARAWSPPRPFPKIGNPAIEIGVSPGFEYRESWDGADGTGFGFDLTWDQQTYGGGYVGTSSKILGSKLAFVSEDIGVGAAEPGTPTTGYASHSLFQTVEEWSPDPTLYPFNTYEQFVEAEVGTADDLTPYDTSIYGTNNSPAFQPLDCEISLLMYASNDPTGWTGGYRAGVLRSVYPWGYWHGFGGIGVGSCDPCGPGGVPSEPPQPGEPAAPWFVSNAASPRGWSLVLGGVGLGGVVNDAYDPSTYAPPASARFSLVEAAGVVSLYQDGVLMLHAPVLSNAGKLGTRCGVFSRLAVPNATCSYFYAAGVFPAPDEWGTYTRDLTGTSLFTLDNFRMGDTPLWTP
jgi:hypothetical protein